MPRYEIRNTANDELSYLTADPSFDLATLLPNGTYRVRAMSEETASIVVSNSAPAISSVSPVDGATGVATTASLVITFNRAMARQGTVDLRNVGGALIESFDLATEGVWSSGDTVWTGDPAVDFVNDAALCVRWSGLQDTIGNTIANNTGDTAWNFTVEAAPAGAITATYVGSVVGDWTYNFGTLPAGWYAVMITQRSTEPNTTSLDTITPPGQSPVAPIETAKGVYTTGGVTSGIFFVELTEERTGDWTVQQTTTGFAVQFIAAIYSLSGEPAVPAANEKAVRITPDTTGLSVNTVAGNSVLVLSSVLNSTEPTDDAGDVVTRDSSNVTNTSVRQQTFSGIAAGGTPEAVWTPTIPSMGFSGHATIAVALKAA